MRAVVEKVDAAEAKAFAAIRERAARDTERKRAKKKKSAMAKRPPQPPLPRS